MQAMQLISCEIPSLTGTDSLHKALDIMSEFKVSHLPLVENQQFMGLVAEEEIVGAKNQLLTLKEVSLNLLNTFVYSEVHILEVVKAMAPYRLTVLPVLGLDKRYTGSILKGNLLQFLNNEMSLDTIGSVIVLSVGHKDLAVSQISQIVESNGAHLMLMYVTAHTDSTRLDITIKVNITDITRLKTDFERYQYEIKAIHNHYDLDHQMIERYKALMNYLSI